MDVVAFKPGNVSLSSPGHGMTADHFLRSADAAAPWLARAGLSVGERIEGAVEATIAAVGCNTNLGIVLLLAPLAHAVVNSTSAVRTADVEATLASLTVDDAVRCYRAIRCARPAGLGRAPQEDISQTPTRDLRSVMRRAAPRDLVAAQYADGYREVFEIGVAVLRSYRKKWRSLAWSVSGCYLHLLARYEDSHVLRKFGDATSRTLRRRALEVEKACKACENPRLLMTTLRAFDNELKSGGVNPGTCADLTVASLFWLLIQERFATLQED